MHWEEKDGGIGQHVGGSEEAQSEIVVVAVRAGDCGVPVALDGPTKQEDSESGCKSVAG